MRISDWSSDVCSSDLIGPLIAVIEQLEWNFRMVLAARIQRQLQLSDVTTLWIDCQLKHVRLDLDQILACSHRGFGRSSGIVCRARDVVIAGDRKRVVWGKSVSVRVDLGGRRILKK